MADEEGPSQIQQQATLIEKLLDERKALRAEVERLREMAALRGLGNQSLDCHSNRHDQCCWTDCTCTCHKRTTIAEVERLRDALEAFGVHQTHCALQYGPGECNCGLAAALAAREEKVCGTCGKTIEPGREWKKKDGTYNCEDCALAAREESGG